MALSKQKSYICRECGKEFTPIDQRNRYYCSVGCYMKIHKKSNTETRVCVVCGIPFDVNEHSKTKTCSVSCGMKYRYMNKYSEAAGRLGEDNQKAREAGMSYGKWRVSQLPSIRPENPKDKFGF